MKETRKEYILINCDYLNSHFLEEIPEIVPKTKDLFKKRS